MKILKNLYKYLDAPGLIVLSVLGIAILIVVIT